MSDERKKEQLKMIWPEQLLGSPPAVHAPIGYTLRTYQPGDEEGFYDVMDLAGFTRWNEEVLRPWFSHILPNGWFLIEHRASSTIVATAMATHRPQDIHPFGGELGWVAGHPDHSGKGLGMAVCASVVRRLLQGGYKNIYLNTDDWRPARTEHLPEAGVDPLALSARHGGTLARRLRQARLALFARGVAREPQVACQNCASHHGVMDRIAYNGRDSAFRLHRIA